MDISLEGLTNIHSEAASPSVVDLPHSGSCLALSMEHGDRTIYHILSISGKPCIDLGVLCLRLHNNRLPYVFDVRPGCKVSDVSRIET